MATADTNTDDCATHEVPASTGPSKGREDDGKSSSNCSILVSNIGMDKESNDKIFDTLKDKLFIHFQKQKYGGGDVENVQITCFDIQAEVTFKSSKVVDSVIKCKDHEIFEKPVTVKKMTESPQHKADKMQPAAVSENSPKPRIFKEVVATVDLKTLSRLLNGDAKCQVEEICKKWKVEQKCEPGIHDSTFVITGNLGRVNKVEIELSRGTCNPLYQDVVGTVDLTALHLNKEQDEEAKSHIEKICRDLSCRHKVDDVLNEFRIKGSVNQLKKIHHEVVAYLNSQAQVNENSMTSLSPDSKGQIISESDRAEPRVRQHVACTFQDKETSDTLPNEISGDTSVREFGEKGIGSNTQQEKQPEDWVMVSGENRNVEILSLNSSGVDAKEPKGDGTDTTSGEGTEEMGKGTDVLPTSVKDTGSQVSTKYPKSDNDTKGDRAKQKDASKPIPVIVLSSHHTLRSSSSNPAIESKKDIEGTPEADDVSEDDNASGGDKDDQIHKEIDSKMGKEAHSIKDTDQDVPKLPDESSTKVPITPEGSESKEELCPTAESAPTDDIMPEGSKAVDENDMETTRLIGNVKITSKDPDSKKSVSDQKKDVMKSSKIEDKEGSKPLGDKDGQVQSKMAHPTTTNVTGEEKLSLEQSPLQDDASVLNSPATHVDGKDTKLQERKLFVKDDYHRLYFVEMLHTKHITQLEKKHSVFIEWDPNVDKEKVFIHPEPRCSEESGREAQEEFQDLVEKVEDSLQYKRIDIRKIPDISAHQIKKGKRALDRFKDKVVYFEICDKKYKLLSEDGKALDEAEAAYYEAIGVPHKKIPKVVSPDSEERRESAQDSKKTEGNLIKQATVGEDMLAYIFTVHRDTLKKTESSKGVEYVWSGGPDVVIIPAKGNNHCSLENIDGVYETFVSFVQELHSNLISKDIDLPTDSKDFPPNHINQARKHTQAQHKTVLVKAVTKDEGPGVRSLRLFGKADDIKAATETFYEYLGMCAPKSRHGGKVKQGGRELERSNSQDGKTESSTYLSYSATNGTKVTICKGDITKANVSVICNAANNRLSHGAGVAGAISTAGGYCIQEESNKILADRGRSLSVAEVVYTKAGNLPCHWVLHVVGPMWDESNAKLTSDILYNCCMNVLKMASKDMKAKSIAIPAIGTGIYKVPKRRCAQAMLYAVQDYIGQQNIRDQLRDIYFLDFDKTTVQVFTKVFAENLDDLGISYSTTQLQNITSSPQASRTGTLPGRESSVDHPSQYTGYGKTSHTGPMQENGASSYADAVAAGAGHGKAGGTADHKGVVTTQGAIPRKPPVSGTSSSSSSKKKDTKEDKTCAICLEEMKKPKDLPCKHKFCKKCIDESEKVSGKICPVCKQIYGVITGDMPKGTMKDRVTSYGLPGYSKHKTIVIDYDIPPGIQGKQHPNPGQWYTGAKRTAYLPDNFEGREVLKLLKISFDRRLTFTVGTSRTTGAKDTVTWNDIHHKTNQYGGADSFGYPDPYYLTRVKDELAAKGVK